MIPSREHTNKPLISITDGKKIGEIKSLYVDLDMRNVAGVYIGSEGIIKRKVLALPQSAVVVVGIDAWLVSSSDTIMALEQIPDSTTYTLVSDLRGREIQTEGGTKLAVVDDVLLDNGAQVLGFTLGKVYSEGPLAERKVIVRDAVSDLGSKEKPMTVMLSQAESLTLPSA